MLKLVLLAVIVALVVRYVPPVRVWIAVRLEGVARDLRHARGGRQELGRQRRGASDGSTEVMHTRAANALQTRKPLLWIDGRTVVLRDGLTIGRDHDAEIRLADSRVSRRHAQVRIQRGVAKIEDLGSRNGTRVSGRNLQGLHTLRDGDMISFGGSLAARFAYDDRTVAAGRPAAASAGA